MYTLEEIDFLEDTDTGIEKILNSSILEALIQYKTKCNKLIMAKQRCNERMTEYSKFHKFTMDYLGKDLREAFSNPHREMRNFIAELVNGLHKIGFLCEGELVNLVNQFIINHGNLIEKFDLFCNYSLSDFTMLKDSIDMEQFNKAKALLNIDILPYHDQVIKNIKEIYFCIIKITSKPIIQENKNPQEIDVNENLKQENEALKEAIQALKKELQIKQKTLVQLDSGGTVEKLQAQIEKLKDRNKELETENEVLENQLAEYAGKIEGYEEELQAQTQTSAFIDNLKM